jgi:hypothetical protein
MFVAPPYRVNPIEYWEDWRSSVAKAEAVEVVHSP